MIVFEKVAAFFAASSSLDVLADSCCVILATVVPDEVVRAPSGANGELLAMRRPKATVPMASDGCSVKK